MFATKVTGKNRPDRGSVRFTDFKEQIEIRATRIARSRLR
jgi:ABC-type uncharacterized transport system ATPase subunit